MPVCAPSLVKGPNALKKPADLKRFTLLHIGSFPDDWQVWLTAAGVKGIDSSRGVSFDFALAAYQAAMDGLGVALGRQPLVDARPQGRPPGRAVRVQDASSEFAYYLVYPPEAIRRRKIKAFRDWIVSLAEVEPRVPSLFLPGQNCTSP